jgi:hypothetical protein
MTLWWAVPTLQVRLTIHATQKNRSGLPDTITFDFLLLTFDLLHSDAAGHCSMNGALPQFPTSSDNPPVAFTSSPTATLEMGVPPTGRTSACVMLARNTSTSPIDDSLPSG